MNLFAPLPAWPWGRLRPHYYSLIQIDPPWNFELFSERGDLKSASHQYKTMTLEKIRALPVAELADVNCLLLMWATAPLLPECIKTMQMWGFQYRSWIHWRKITRKGKVAMGTGYRVRTMGELLLLGTIGDPKHKAFRGDVAGIRREHSRKPEEIFHEIDKRCTKLTRRCDVFSRQSRDGWDCWGDEVGIFDKAA